MYAVARGTGLNREEFLGRCEFVILVVGLSMAIEVASTADTPTPAELYTVENGNHVDPKTLEGWKTWRALACERCHGAEQEGLVGPPLVESLKHLSKEEFHTTITNGRPEKGMPNFGGSKMVMANWEGLYAYLKGRSDGKILPGHLYAIGQP
jgi:Cytochrome C oxidase, cbb3-type, subunit III